MTHTSRPTVRCYVLDDEAVLFCKATGDLYRLNTTATFIWCCCEENLAPLAIARALSEAFQIGLSQARHDVVRAFSAWQRQGLLASQEAVVASARVCPKPDVPTYNAIQLTPTASLQYYQSYRIWDSWFYIRSPSASVAAVLKPVFAHLELPSPPRCEDVATVFDVLQNGPHYTVAMNAMPIAARVRLAELAPLVQRHMLLTAYAATDCMVAIHAAALVHRGACILLAGAPGSGKSTLGAALARSGLIYLTDELALVAAGTSRIRGAPVSLSIKHGSWPLLSPLYPGLDELPIYRQDGETLRYLPPPTSQAEMGEYPAKWLIFPIYAKGEPAQLRKLNSRAEILYRLAEAGYATPQPLDEACLGEIIDWLSGIDCYELRGGNLHEGVRQIKALLT